MKQPLVEIVQGILDNIDGEFINSISDTEESLQIASIVRTTYYELFNRKAWPHSKKISTLQSLSNNDYPTYLKLPERLYSLETFNYNKSLANDDRLLLSRVRWKEPDEFLRHTNAFNIQNDNTEVVTSLEGATLKIMTDRAPQFYTTFDDEHLVMDSYDKSVEDTLQGDKTQVIYFEVPEFRIEDSFIPDLPDISFPYLIAEATSACSLKVRQVEDAKAEQQSKRQSIRAAQRSRRATSGTRYPNYGRRGGKGSTYFYNTQKLDKWSTYEGSSN